MSFLKCVGHISDVQAVDGFATRNKNLVFGGASWDELNVVHEFDRRSWDIEAEYSIEKKKPHLKIPL